MPRSAPRFNTPTATPDFELDAPELRLFYKCNMLVNASI